jgi:hypothetical protein
VDALSTAYALLSRVATTARVRELLAQARSYERAVKHWTTIPPTEAQLDAMFDVVAELHAKAIATAQPRRRASGEHNS